MRTPIMSLDTTFDAGERRDVAVRIWAPTSGGPYPVIVFSHGGGASGTGYEYLVRAWAEHGYVVVLPTHRDSIAAVMAAGEPLGQAVTSMVAQANDPAAWAQRVVDVNTAIEKLPEFESRLPSLHGRIDVDRVGVAGHSFGAFTAMLAEGATPASNRIRLPAPDPRVGSFALLSGQGVGQQGLTADSYRGLTRPTLVMTGTLDEGQVTPAPGQTRQTYEQKLDPFRLSPPGDKFAVVIDGATHFTFSGLGSLGPLARFVPRSEDSSPGTYSSVIWATTRFWDATLRTGAMQGPALQPGDERDAPSALTITVR